MCVFERVPLFWVLFVQVDHWVACLSQSTQGPKLLLLFRDLLCLIVMLDSRDLRG